MSLSDNLNLRPLSIVGIATAGQLRIPKGKIMRKELAPQNKGEAQDLVLVVP